MSSAAGVVRELWSQARGQIARGTEYWTDPPTEAPPAWRAEWVERY